MKLSALIAAPCHPDPEITGVTCDSRAVRPGFLFAALRGEKADGAAFIPQAEENGAAAVLAAPGATSRVALVVDPDPRRRYAAIAARFYPRQPGVVVGVTGTNGKTSTARFAAQLWTRLGARAGSIGTLGAAAPDFERPLAHTTPEPATLHEILDGMAGAGATHVAMEVSSHALVQRRADAVRFSAAAFTNITQDHLDYHPDLDDYLRAKQRLFTELLPKGAPALVNADGEGADRIAETARAAGRRPLTIGARGDFLRITRASPHAAGLALDIAHPDGSTTIDLPFVGAFQAENALLAAGLVIALGAPAGAVVPLLPGLERVPGRMQRVAEVAGAVVYVDYAHTPNAIATALAALRPHARGRLVAVIGAGGDRDSKKRPLMGKAAARGADHVIVTDDNPRSEDPSAIRRAILEGAPRAEEIADRGEAIARAVSKLDAGDVLLIAGKGHETGQTVGAVTLPFDDAAVALQAARRRGEVGT
jgi:UDP-N-acetylmuramoyl-L-alanyl-D-glutamate--2,6-diaminopimelate ligase